MKKKKRKLDKSKLVTNLLLIIFIGVFIYSGYNVFIWLNSDRKTKKLEEGLYSEVTEDDATKGNISVDFTKLKSENSDIFAWIRIKDTYINYPILQGETDEYYLKKDIYKKYNVAGSIFVDSTTNKEFLDDNTVIYGHNMKNQRMFADLYKIYDGSMGEDINVEIYTEQEFTNYKVFSAYIVEPNIGIIIKNFKNNDEKQEYINSVIKKSKIKFDTSSLDYDKGIITLITCNSAAKYRMVVHAAQEIN